MKYPYVALDTIMAEVETQFKTLNRQGKYDEGDAYVYAIEAAREIGVNNYDEDTVALPISRHIGALPEDFYLVKEIWQARVSEAVDQQLTTVLDSFKGEAVTRVERTHLMAPGDSATVRYCQDKRTPFLSANTPSYVIKSRQRVVRTSFRDGLVVLNYFHLPKDDRGVVMIQDEVNTIKCVKAYVLLNMIKEDYLLGKIADYVYARFDNEYYTYLSQAKGTQKLPDPSTDKFHANALRNRYNPFKL